MADLIILRDTFVSGDGLTQVKEAQYSCSDETEADEMYADIIENGFTDPGNSEIKLTNFQVYLLKQFGRFILLILFGIPLP